MLLICPHLATFSHNEHGQKIRNTGVQEGSVFREDSKDSECCCPETHQDLGHYAVKLALLAKNFRTKCVINR